MNRTRMAVIGVGHLGRHHARILAAMPEVDLVAVVDTRLERAAEIASTHATRALTDALVLVGRVDAVTIATPTVSHVEVALPFVEAGVAVLVEKPLAANLAEADRLVGAAAARGTVLATGHTERFNPAVAAAVTFVSSPRFIEIHRLGSFPERSLDIDVIFDLMIHDLDVLLAVVGSDVASVEAGWRQCAHAAGRHCQRAPAFCIGLHRQPDRQPDQPRPRAQGPLLSARLLRVD